MVEALIIQEVASMITQFGFPIVMTIWFMIRTENVITNNTLMMQKTTEVMGAITTVIQNCKK